MLKVVTAAREINQDTPHQLRRDCEEVRAALPMHVARINEAQISLIDQRGRLQRLAGPLTAHVAPGYTVQFVMDQRNQLIERCLLTVAPGQQQSSNFLRWALGHPTLLGWKVLNSQVKCEQVTTGLDTLL